MARYGAKVAGYQAGTALNPSPPLLFTGRALDKLPGPLILPRAARMASEGLVASVLKIPDDFPASHLRDEYADIRQALTWLPPEEGSGQGLLESTLEAMTEDGAATLSKSLFSLYTSAAEAVYGGLHGR